MKQTHERLTLEDIAKEIHISRTTIYKVIHQKGNVNEATRNTVMEALKRYNYVPNNNARNLAMNRRYRIAFVSFRSLDAAYFAPTVEEGIRQAVRDYGDHGLAVETYISSAEHPGQQAEDIRQAFDSGIRDFVIACADAEQLKPVLLRLRKQACRVILLSKYAGPDTCDTFIGADDQKSGRLAAEVLGHMIPGNGSVQILVPRESRSNQQSTRQRLEGFLAGIRALRPSIRLLPPLEARDSPAGIAEALSDILSTRRPDGIYDLTCRLEIISRTLRRKGMEDTSLVGMDLFPEIVPFIRDHTIDAVIFQNLKAQAYLACRLLFEQMCYGTTLPQKTCYSRLEIVMSGNLEYYLEESLLPSSQNATALAAATFRESTP
ncbi:MAG: substrate-binding domain-containing protein [Lachnospiraceae bacterium]|nr:substrate-binding domain-containing protein [Lachnospiraceae bacterium]